MEDLGQTGAESEFRSEEQASAGDKFTATHWSIVALASQQNSDKAAAALEALCRTYWYPLYSYVRRRGYKPEEAQDLTQEFFAQLLQHGTLAQADPQRGKFRCFLLSCMTHFLANQWRRSHAAKRHPEAILPLDPTAENRYGQDLGTDLNPEKLYERRWALSLFERALIRLRQQHLSTGKEVFYEKLKEFLSSEPQDGDYARVGAELGITNGAVSTAVYRLREKYRDLVREEVAHTVCTREELEDELRWLIVILGS